MAFRNEVQRLNCTSNGTKLHTEFLKHGTVIIVIANLKYLNWKGNGMKCEIKKDRIMSGWSEICKVNLQFNLQNNNKKKNTH